ncbi:cysteine desulfurase [Sporosarcina sp. NCCP-2716]|uniref:cysteine desulfurase family protein n=1 Tax=Sporosarcina sp. NCCP-2716 TaxID=2943679 RepID=UPI002040C79D|nr:cysteine desulfurase family protein [Sporosarcina sp. NCCP-2716]GKV69559.1 cysteine desulfurase [Sporosarcina sp. NCCP-2716]
MIYLDNSATTMPADEVLRTFTEASRSYFANPASLHNEGSRAGQLLESARSQIARLAGDGDAEVVFTSGGTEANNLAVIGFAKKYRYRGNHLITTAAEHDSVRKAFEYLETQGFEVDWLSVDEHGRIDTDELARTLRSDTILVSIMHVNNEIGTVMPLEECAPVIRRKSRAVIHSDCVQSVGKLALPFPDYADAVTVSGHKIRGLKGTGCLITKRFTLPAAISFGGGQEDGLRSGTVNVAGAAAFAKAFRLALTDTDTSAFRSMTRVLHDGLAEEKRVRILSPLDGAPHIFSMAFQGVTGEVAVNYFQEQGLLISTSSACSSKSSRVSHVVEALKLPDDFRKGAVRISFGQENTVRDAERILEVTRQFLQMTKKGLKQHDME